MLRKNIYKKKTNKFFAALILIMAITIYTLVYVDSQLRPIIQNMAKYRVQSKIVQIANNTIMEEMAYCDINYDDLVTLNQNSNDIVILSYNTATVNRVKALLTSKIISNIDDLQRIDIFVPVANITGIEFLQNRGPKIKFTVYPTAFLETDIESEFENTGINQVVHKIYITLHISANAFVPNYSSNVSFSTKVCIAQTVIVGKVPNNLADYSHRIID